MGKDTKKSSINEDHFLNWLKELETAYVVRNIKAQPRSFSVYPNSVIVYKEQMKTKEKYVDWNLFQPIEYTPDFKVTFVKDTKFAEKFLCLLDGFPITKKPTDILFFYTETDKEGNPIVYLEVKPPNKAIKFSAKVSSARDFPVKQRILFETKNVYVNKVIPYGSSGALFGKTFTPDSYYFTDSGKQLRANSNDKYEKRLLEDFLKMIRQQKR